MDTPDVKPFEDDIEYLGAELEWIDRRCRRLTFGQDQFWETGMTPEERYDQFDDPLEALADPGIAAGADECDARCIIDWRLEATAAADRQLSIHRTALAHDLGEFERDVLLLAAAPYLAKRFREYYFELGGAEGLTVEAVFTFMELTFAERIRRRVVFGESSPLMKSGLVSVEDTTRSARPADLLDREITLTPKGLGALLGNYS